MVLGAASAAGCGGSSPASATATQLTIEVRTGTVATALRLSRATLRCDGKAVATGFLHSGSGRACALVRRGAIQEIVIDQRSRRICSQIYSGPQSAHIRGIVNADPVNLTVTRTDGCGTADWQTLEPLLGDPQR